MKARDILKGAVLLLMFSLGILLEGPLAEADLDDFANPGASLSSATITITGENASDELNIGFFRSPL